MKKKNSALIIPIIASILLASVLFSYAQEQITITTYYPAPFGVYANMNVTNQIKMVTVGAGAVSGVGPGVWFAPPNGVNNPSQIVSYNSGGEQGLRMVYYTPGAGTPTDVVRVGQVNGGVFSGLYVQGNSQSFFTTAVTVNQNLTVLGNTTFLGQTFMTDLRLNKDSGWLDDPLSVAPYLPKLPWRNKAHL